MDDNILHPHFHYDMILVVTKTVGLSGKRCSAAI